MADQTPASSGSRVRAATVENAFPTPPRRGTPNASFRINGRSSPAPGKLLNMQRAQSTPPELTDGAPFRHVSRGTTGDLPDTSSLEQSWSRTNLSKKKSQYYSDAFAYREPQNSARERVIRDSMIIAEVKLNCCLNSEQEFLIDLSFRVSEIYHRPEGSVMVLVATDIPMVIAGSSEPAYTMTITALPPEIAITKNKRSAHLLQQFMQESLSISPKRGVVRYEAVAASNLATNGMTALQEMELLDRESQDEVSAFRTLSRAKSRNKRSSLTHPTDRGKTPTSNMRRATPLVPPTSVVPSAVSTKPGDTKRRKMKPRRSIFDIFRRRSLELLKE